jgi:hypothetical protein
MAVHIAFLKMPWKISGTNSVRWSGSGSSKGGSSVAEDQLKGAHKGKDDDVEAHAHKGAPVDSHKAANDEGDDVEAHMHKASHKASHKA